MFTAGSKHKAPPGHTVGVLDVSILDEEGEGRHSPLTSHCSLSVHCPSSPGCSAYSLRAQLIDTAFYISPITPLPDLAELGSCISVGLLASATSEPGSRGAQTEQVRAWMHPAPAPPATRPHPRIKGRKAACSPGRLQQACKQAGEFSHQVDSPASWGLPCHAAPPTTEISGF